MLKIKNTIDDSRTMSVAMFPSRRLVRSVCIHDYLFYALVIRDISESETDRHIIERIVGNGNYGVSVDERNVLTIQPLISSATFNMFSLKSNPITFLYSAASANGRPPSRPCKRRALFASLNFGVSSHLAPARRRLNE